MFKKIKNYKKVFLLIVVLPILTAGIVFTLAEIGTWGENGSTAAPNTLSYGLVGYWDFEEGQGQTVYDKSGNGNDGTLGSSTSIESSDPVFGSGHDSSGESGTGLVFDGLNNYTKIENDDSFNITGDLTLQAWIKTTDYGYGGIVTKLNETTHYGYGLVKSGNKGYFVIMQGAYETGIPTDIAIDDGDWHHIVGVRSSGTDYLYLDGIIQSTTDSNILTDSGQGVVVGSHYWHSTNSRYPFEGSIDEVRIYNRALSEDEIRQLYNQKKPVLEMNFNEGYGTNIHDNSFNNYDARVYNKINTAISSTSNTLYDNDVSWATNQWAGREVSIIYGTGIGQTRTISSNTSDTLTVSTVWDTNPDSTSRYSITLDGASVWSERGSGNALSIDNVGYVGFYPNTVPISGTGDFTLESWIKTDDAYTQFIMQQRDSSAVSGEYIFEIDGGKLRYWDYGSTYGINFSSNQSVNNGVWHHAVFTRSGSTGYLFIDGVLDNSYSGSIVNISSSLDFAIGCDFRDAGNYFYGEIDDVKVYNYARTADEIKTDYNESKAAHLGESNQDLDYGLVGYWDFEEGSGQTVYDKSGNGNDGTLGSSTSIESSDPFFGQGHDSSGENGIGMIFDGVNDYVGVSNNEVLQINGAITLAGWVNWDVGTQAALFGKGRSISANGNYGYFVSYWSDGGVYFDTYSSTTRDVLTTGSGAIVDSDWHFIVATWDGTQNADGKKIYIDGVEKVSKTSSISSIGNPSSGFTIGKDEVSSRPVSGSLDEVRVYNRALSEDEIRQLYNQKKPVLELNFDEGLGTTAYDESFNNNDGTLGGGTESYMPTWTDGKFGSALDFDGSDDYIDCGNDSILNQTVSELSISFWMKGNNSLRYSTMISTANPWTDENGYAIGYNDRNSNNKVSFYFDRWGSSKKVISQSSLTDGTWYFVSGTYDGDIMELYVNGILEDSESGVVLDANTKSLIVGTASVGADWSTYFKGSLDDIKVYNYARTADEILSDYNEGKAAHLGESNQDLNYGLVGYWDFEEGTGQTIYDKSGNGNDGTLGSLTSIESSDPVFGQGHDSSGDNGTGMSFDGINDYVHIGSKDSLNMTNFFTISLWTKISDVNDEWRHLVKNYNINNSIVNGYYVAYRSSTAGFRIMAGDGTVNAFSQTDDLSFENDVWYHVVATYDGSNLGIYLNGILIDEDPLSSLGVTTSQFEIGSSSAGYGPDGLVDEVRIYNRALSEDEIRQLYNQKKPVLEMNFDEGSGDIAFDKTFNQNNGALGGGTTAYMPTWVDGKFDSALSFDGVDDYIKVLSSSSITPLKNYSFSMWVYNKAGSKNYPTLFNKRAQSTGSGFFWCYTGGTNESDIRFQYSNGTTYSAVNFSNILSVGVWQHLVFTFDDSTKNLKLYLDGKDTVQDKTLTNSLTVSEGDLYIGTYNGSSVNYPFYGMIDDFKIYNYTRTADEILSDYNNGLAVHFR